MNKKSHKDVSPVIYCLETNSSPDQILALLETGFQLEKSAENMGLLRILDTYDWRLLRNHLELHGTAGENLQHLILRNNRNGQILATADTKTLPDNVNTLPPGRLNNLLRNIVKSRKLLIACELKTNSTEYNIRDEQHKSVARLHLHAPGSCKFRDMEPLETTTLAQVIPIRGNDSAFRQVCELIGNHLKHTREECCIGEYFARSFEHPLFRFYTRPELQIAPDTPTDQAIKLLLTHYYNIMRHNEPGIMNQVDTECLHDFRTAIRRSRSLIRSFKKIFPDELYPFIREEFEWLSTCTSDTRDIDVQLESFPVYEDMIPAYMHHGLRLLKKHLATVRDKYYESVVEALQSARYQHFCRKWADFLETTTVSHPKFSNTSICEVANRKIWKTYLTVLRYGNKIDEFSEDDALHSLRKLCKKLRYLLESFQSIYPDKEIKKSIKELKHLQNFLGEYQDLSAQVNSLEHTIPELSMDENDYHMCIDSIRELQRVIQERKRYLRTEYHKVFKSFSSGKNRKKFKKSYKHYNE